MHDGPQMARHIHRCSPLRHAAGVAGPLPEELRRELAWWRRFAVTTLLVLAVAGCLWWVAVAR